MAIRIGIDVGGTYTDIAAVDASGGRAVFHKVRSTPSEPFRAVLHGLDEILQKLSASGGDIAFIGHGTTVVTNMIVERKGARTGVVTTRGCRDVLELARQSRPHLYDYRVTRPPPLAGREDRIEISERIRADGSVDVAPSPEDVDAAAGHLIASGVEAVAVCLLHSYRNAAHERAIAERLRERLPGVFISVSSDVSPEFREYERFSTTVINAFVGRTAATYFEGVEAGFRDRGVPCPFYTVSSNGGLLDIQTVRDFPVRTALSGPSAGVVGATRLAHALGLDGIVTFDVGGTSTDIAIVENEPRRTRQRELGGYPILAPMVDMEVIGAGGGSLASVDRAGGLRVGPESAGADPGPVAYGQGGTGSTLTDALLVLGALGTTGLAGGAHPLDRSAAARAIELEVGGPLSLSCADAASGIVKIAAANMSRAIRSAAVAKGCDPKRFTLVAYGGAGPLMACDVADLLGIDRIMVPASPGTLCAQSILFGELRRDYSQTIATRLGPESWPAITDRFAALISEANDWLAGETTTGRPGFEHVFECRYAGQNFELGVEFPSLPDDADELKRAFAAAHRREQGTEFPEQPVDVMTVRLVVTSELVGAGQRWEVEDRGQSASTAKEPRDIYFGEHWQRTTILDRSSLTSNDALAGPLVIEEPSSTILVKPDFTVRAVDGGTIMIERARRAG